MMKKMNAKRMGIVLSAGLLVAGLSACGAGESSEGRDAKTAPTAVPTREAVQPAGTLLLSVNPEIELDYDQKGNVLALEGINADGKKVVEAYPDFEGKSCRDVVGDLVTEINEAGYFDTTIEGHEKNIILKLAKGSEYPDDDFLEGIAEEVRTTVEANQIGSQALALDEDDYDKTLGSKGYISAEAARDIISKQLGRTDLQFVEKEYELDDGVYEIEFLMDGVGYEYEVNAVNGKVQKVEAYDDTDYGPNNDGVTDYNDTDYGPNNDGVTDYDDTDYGPNNDGVTDYNDTDYGPNNDGVTDYDDTDYGPNNDGVTDYNDTDYGPNNDGVTDYDDTDYGPNNDGVTDYNDTDYGPYNDGVTDYNDTDYGPNNDGVTDYYDDNDGYTDYEDDDDGYTDYEDDDDGYTDYD